MLSALERVRREPGPAAAALVGGLVAGLAIGWATGAAPSRSDSRPTTVVAVAPAPATSATPGTAKTTTAKRTTTVPPQAAPRPASAELEAVRKTLRAGVARADALGGRSAVAVWRAGWSAPVVVGDAVDRPMRMWSISKAVTAVAVFQNSPKPSPTLSGAMLRAITRSENCPQRRVVLGLQALSGGTPQTAEAAFARVLAHAQARVDVHAEAVTPESGCLAYLQAHRGGLRDPGAEAPQLGTVEWRIRDAARFAQTLAEGAYGQAGANALALLGRPKGKSEEAGAKMTAPLDWGAGAALRGLEDVAYKGGWGGADAKSYVAAQIAMARVDGLPVAMVAAFHPTAQPATDDPGETQGPAALEALFGAARTVVTAHK